jgi:hypothetical protein
MSETAIQKAIRVAVNASGRAIVWRNNTGVDVARGVRYGLGNGSADLVGMLVPSGRFLALEVKTPVGRLSNEQILWIDVVRKRGGAAYCVRSVAEALEAVDHALRGMAP